MFHLLGRWLSLSLLRQFCCVVPCSFSVCGYFLFSLLFVLCYVSDLGLRLFRSPSASWWFSVQLSFRYVCVCFVVFCQWSRVEAF